MNKKFEAISTTVGMGLKGAIVDAAFALQQFIDKFNSVQSQQVETLEARMRELGLRRVEIENSLITNPRSGRGDTRRDELRRLAEEEAKILAEYERRQIITPPGEPPRLPAPPTVPTVPGSGAPSTTADAMNARLEALRQSLMTEEQLEMDSHAKRLEEIQKFHESGAILRGEYDTMLQTAQEQHADRMTEIAKRQVEEETRLREVLVSNVASIFGSLSSLAESFGDKNLGIAKAFAVADIGISTAQGIMKALGTQGPLGWVQAAAIGAAGAAQLASVMSARPGGAQVTSPSGGSAAAASAPASSPEPTRTMNFTFTGEGGISREQFRQFVEAANEFGGDGLRFTFSGA